MDAVVVTGILIMLVLVSLAIVAWWRTSKKLPRERFVGDAARAYSEDLAALPSGLALYLSAFSDASTASTGRWADLSGQHHDFTFDRSASAPLSTDPGARGFDLAGCVLIGPPAVDILPTAGQDFSLVWVARDAAPPVAPQTLFKLRANTQTNNGIQVTLLNPPPTTATAMATATGSVASGAGATTDAIVTLAAAVGSGAAGVWRFPASPDMAVNALVRHGPELAFFRNGARLPPASEPGAADDGMLFANPTAIINPEGAWSGRLGAVAVWGRALQDLDVASVTAHLRAEAGDLPRVRAEAKSTLSSAEEAREKAVRDAVAEADARARAEVEAAIASVTSGAKGGVGKGAPQTLRLREGFLGNGLGEADAIVNRYQRLSRDQVAEAAEDAIALVNGGASIRVV